MTRKSSTKAPIPAPAVVRKVIRLDGLLADANAAARAARCPAGDMVYTAADFEILPRIPEEVALLDYLQQLSAEDLAGLYAIYRLGDGRSGTVTGNMYRYSSSYINAIRPNHREHAAYDLAAKAPLSHRLRRGLERLELGGERDGADGRGDGIPSISLRAKT